MLTLFSVPKAFRGPIAVIQRNAIQSWLHLRPACEVILLGDDPGTAETAREFGIRHVADLPRNEFGTPLLNGIFELAQAGARHRLVCYVNTDIILMNDFTRTVSTVQRRLSRFLMIGERMDVDIVDPISFANPAWDVALQERAHQYGKPHGRCGMDYFVFPKSLLGTIPPLALGRRAWDNWLVFHARRLGLAVVDASKAVLAVHQNHDFSHVPTAFSAKPRDFIWNGPEFARNLNLCGPMPDDAGMKDATWVADGRHVRRAVWWRRWRREAAVFGELYPEATRSQRLRCTSIRAAVAMGERLGLVPLLKRPPRPKSLGSSAAQP